MLGLISRSNVLYGGRKQVSGAVTGLSGSRKVRLYDRAGGGLVAETWSDNSTGSYSFVALAGDPQEYIALSIDYLNVWNCAVADRPLLTDL